MKTLNLFKSIKNISYVTAFACLPLSSACGDTTPQQIIEAYAKDAYLCWASGNVLAYKNIEGKIVVLKSGSVFADKQKGVWDTVNGRTLECASDVKVVTLEEVFHYVTCNTDYANSSPHTPTQEELKLFGDYCRKDNEDWYNSIKSKYPYKMENLCGFEKKSNYITLFQEDSNNITINIDNDYKKQGKFFQYGLGTFIMDPCTYIQVCFSKNLHTRLGNFRHTEIQIQALWNKYCECQDEKTKKEIAFLLPKALTAPENKSNKIDDKIYSLFETCDACEKTTWLQNKKGIFMFRILDSQFVSKRHKVKNDGFMSQENWEKKKKALEEELNKDFEELK